ncbi:MAG: sodium-extruding oxaloacetate decarboxylase subunit alpha [bacterium]
MVMITDTVLRDAHQSLLATRMATKQMLPIASKLDKVGYFSLEMWGGATFDSCIRFLREDPWERIRTLRKSIPNTRFQMLLRGQNIVGYRNYADDVVERFVELSANAGIDVFRIFDALNDTRNLRTAMKATKRFKKHAEGTISYTTSPVHTLDFYVDMAVELANMGADTICVKDMAGLLAPYAAYDLVTAIKKKIDLPIHLHCHATTGMSETSYIKGIEAGASIIDTSISSMALGTSQPATESMVAALKGTQYDTGIDLGLLEEIAEYFKKVRAELGEHESGLPGVDARILAAQIPGGMLSNLASQLRSQNAMDRYDEVLREVVQVRADLGYPPLVTPTSQVVGTQAVINVLQGERYKVLTEHTKNYILGKYGRPPGEIRKDLIERVIAETGEKPIEGRPADLIPPEIEKNRQELRQRLGREIKSEEDVLTYVLFPEVAIEFFDIRDGYKKPEPPKVEKKEPAKQVVSAEKEAPRTATYRVTVEGRTYEVVVEDIVDSQGQVQPSQPKVSETIRKPVDGKPVNAPLTGDVLRILCSEGAMVKQGDPLIVLEAMKMETKVVSPHEGKIISILVKQGDKVSSGDTLVLIS